MEKFSNFMTVALILVAVLFAFIFINCTFMATINANSGTSKPPGVFQFAEGWECTKDVWRFYLGLGG